MTSYRGANHASNRPTMTTPYPLCVFLESREQGRLTADHPFYGLVEETLQNVIRCPLILHYMAKTLNTTVNGSCHIEVADERRIQEITEYLQNDCPTVSGSDSPTMDLTFVDVRAYSGCGSDPKSRKIARKHIYIQKQLVNAWMKAECNLTDRDPVLF